MKCQEFVFEQTLKDMYVGDLCLGANMGAVVAKGRRNSDIVAARRYSRRTQSNEARLSYSPQQIFTISRFGDEFVEDDIVAAARSRIWQHPWHNQMEVLC